MNGDRQPELTTQDVLTREQFLAEFRRQGFDPINAVIALGYQERVAAPLAKRFMTDAYVISRIPELEAEGATYDELEALFRTAVFKGLKSKDANVFNNTTKVFLAWTKLRQDKSAVDGAAVGGVMLVPYFSSEYEWERVAMEQQKLLMSEAKG